VDESAADNPSRSQLLAELSEALGQPVVAIVSGWQGDNIVNLGDEAVRAFLEVLDEELERAEDEVDSVALYLVGRGGFPVFAEGVWRALSGRGIETTAVVPYRADGIYSLLCLSAKQLLMHPYGAVGAYDRRPLGRFKARIDGESLLGLSEVASLEIAGADALAELGFERRQAQLCRELMKRMVGGTESGTGARVERSLCAESLGGELALSAAELDRVGLSARVADPTLASLIWRIYCAYEQELEILEPPTPRYTASDVADEVEFAPAMGLTGALIEGRHRQIRYELDTGSPDPDTNMLTGEWLWEPMSIGDLI
jgi:hypothetical protein